MSEEKKKVTRRDFVKATGVAATGAAVATVGVRSAVGAGALDVDRAGIVGAMGDTFVPTDAGDPGYRVLEGHNITAEVLKELEVSEEDLALFNSEAGGMFGGRTFVQLKEEERGKYFEAVDGGKVGSNKEVTGKLQRALRRVRQRVYQVYYSNYPEHAMPRDKNGVPILPVGDQHQITNPNTKGLVTGWDVAGFMGPLTWQEEERRREKVKKIDWKE